MKYLYHTMRKWGITKQKLPSCIALVLCPILTFYLFDAYTHNPLTAMNFKTQLLNIVFYELMGFLLFGLLKYVRLALMLQSGFFMLIGLANYYVMNFRSAPIMPWDIFSIGTAASVAGNYSYALKKEAVAILLAFGALLLVESRFSMRAPRRKTKRGLLILLPLFCLWGYTGLVQNESFVRHFGLYDKLFTPAVMNKRDGNVVAFLMEMEYLDVEKPEGYSPREAGAYYRSYESEELQAALGNPKDLNRPNIIVIMDEAFSDLSVLGELKMSQDEMPFIHSLCRGGENISSGYLNVSVLGGNTANTEFEFLTGNTMQFLPQGSVAYQQYVKESLPALPSYLQSLGYETVAMHPYYADGWERDRVYPLLGFERFLALEDFRGAEKIRRYVSDRACFDKIIDLYEEKEAGKPLFVFNVTMQNHGGYDEEFDNFQNTVSAEGITAKSLPAYLSLLKETDEALQELIEYFSGAEEDTLIVFFGDHQPSAYVSNPILRANGVNPDGLTEEENLLRYKVPYVIWSNFDTEEGRGQETSANYLAIDVLKAAGLPLPPYQAALQEIRKEYPVVSAMQIRDKQDRLITEEEGESGLRAYRSLAYYLLFDYEHTKGRPE